MVTTDIVLSAYVGGSTGKSLFTHMRTAYRLADADKNITVAVIDASHGAALYESIGVLFNREPYAPDNDNDQNVLLPTCYYYAYPSRVSEPEQKFKFYAFRPKSRFISTCKELKDLFTSIKSFFSTENIDVDYLICETNLPHAIVADGHCMRDVIDLWDNHKINLWSTWNTAALLNESEYLSIIDPYMQMSEMNINWYHVHNPFSTTTGLPEETVSRSIKECHDIEHRSGFFDPEMLLDYCWQSARETSLNVEASNEAIWGSAYSRFVKDESRPTNLLPIYKRIKKWGRVYLNQYHYKDEHGKLLTYKINSKKSFTQIMDELSENLYSDIFKGYFDSIE